MLEQFSSKLTLSARVIAEEIEEEIDENHFSHLNDELLELLEFQAIPRYFVISDEQGRRIIASMAYRSEFNAESHFIPFPFKLSKGINMELPNGKPGLMVSERFGSEPHSFVVTVMDDRSEIEEAFQTGLFIIFGTAGFFIILSMLIVPGLLKRGLAPIGQLNEQISAIDARSLNQQLSVDEMPVEIQPIVSRLNELLSRLDDSFERERRINSDLAHELRTPVAELKLAAETILKWPENREENHDKEILAIAIQMETLVERMLQLARSENDRLAVNLETINVQQVINEELAVLKTRIASQELEISSTVAITAIHTDAFLFRIILKNLLDNAIAYSPSGSNISIYLTGASMDHWKLEIQNQTTDLESDDLLQLKERYWRKESSRQGNHLGIGIAIIFGFSKALGASVDYELEDQQLKVVVERQADAFNDESTSL